MATPPRAASRGGLDCDRRAGFIFGMSEAREEIAGADQLPGVGLALVTQHVVLVGNHQRRGQAPPCGIRPDSREVELGSDYPS